MVPRIGETGTSFKGAGLYYLHDKQAMTAERVAFTQTHNLPTDDPERALDWMAWTARHQSELKARAGVSAAGGNCEKPVFHYSLAWHPDESPDESHMLSCARETLEALGLGRHEAVFVAHRDQAHPHLHVIANLVNPETGRTASVSFSKRELSRWAEAYEREHGIHCEQRLENNARRRQGEAARYEEPAVMDKAAIQSLWRDSEDLEAFRDGLEAAGCRLARGDRRGVVVVDPAGEVASLSRQLAREQRAELKAALKGRDLGDLPDVETAKAALAETEAASEPEPEREEGEQEDGRGHEGESGGTENTAPDLEDDQAERLVALQDRQLAELGAAYTRFHDRRTAMDAALAAQFDAPLAERRAREAALAGSLAQSTGIRGFWRRLTGQDRRDADELEMVAAQIRSMEQRITESRAVLAEGRETELAAISARHVVERTAIGLDQRPDPQREVTQRLVTEEPDQAQDGPSQSGP
ncbi:MAG: relaxase/mobilization nuclease domain-containing protein [Pseudomonadota bacterium]